jgi:hypothetical protein
VTTVHASLPPKSSAKASTAKAKLVHLNLIDRDGKIEEIEASLAEILHAVKDSGGVGVFELQNGDAEPKMVIVQKVEKDGQAITEMTLREVRPEDYIRVEVEVAPTSLPDVVKGKKAEAVRLKRRVKVRARVKDLPRTIKVDLSEMTVSETMKAGDLNLPKGVELITPKDADLFTVRTVAGG